MTDTILESPRNAQQDLSATVPTTRLTTLPRFNLKKRTISGANGCGKSMNLATVNSAFLTGLFEDVAKVQTVDSVPTSDDEISVDDLRPRKKTRLSKTKSMIRCGKSFKSLSQACSPNASCSDFLSNIPQVSPATSNNIERCDSLQYQLSCVSDASSSDDSMSTKAVVDAGKLVFPYLPSTSSTLDESNPSSTSSNTPSISRKVSDLQIHLSGKDSYGWFVEMDDDNVPAVSAAADPYACSTATLAFRAPTAPKAANYDAEVEWARAADTVDDVLGDFF